MSFLLLLFDKQTNSSLFFFLRAQAWFVLRGSTAAGIVVPELLRLGRMPPSVPAHLLLGSFSGCPGAVRWGPLCTG